MAKSNFLLFRALFYRLLKFFRQPNRLLDVPAFVSFHSVFFSMIGAAAAISDGALLLMSDFLTKEVCRLRAVNLPLGVNQEEGVNAANVNNVFAL